MMPLPVPSTTPRRVKVYELRNNDWFDRGTGYCTGQLVNEEPHIQVKSEEESDRVLLNTKIIKDDGYQKQQETLIVWTEPQGTDMALSFQEPEGCAAIWEFVSHVQSHLLGGAGISSASNSHPMRSYTDVTVSDEILSDDAGESAISPLPTPELGNLDEVELMIRQASSTASGRDMLGKYILTNDYIAKLIPLLGMAEDLESLSHLHRLCNIMKMIILLNDTVIVEKIVTDEMVMGVVGILEYDPDFPSHKANHRQFLGDKSKFKEVVPISEPEVEKKIHQTYRLQYLKDVVLARILDDPTFSVLNSLIFFNQFDILQHLQNNQAFLKDLFSIFHDPEASASKKKLAILFIQTCCSIAKSIQAPARAQLYTQFIQNGLFGVIDYALMEKDASIRIVGTDVLVAMIDHDSVMIRSFIYRQINDKQKPLTHTLIELLLGEQDLGVKAQIVDAVRVLLDHSQAMPLDSLSKGGDMAARIHARSNTMDSETESFLKAFYEESAKKLFAPLRELQSRQSLIGLSIPEVSLYSHLVETLCFFVRHHPYRSKYFLLTENLPSRVAQLLRCPEKHLKLTALKFFRTCVGLQDEFYIRHMVKYKLFEPILDLVVETMPRDNLLNSACLEFFEFIRRENLKHIILHLVDNYREVLSKITYVRTFTELIAKYDQLLDPAPVARFQDEQNYSQRPQVNGNRRWQGLRDMDDEQETYFNSSDDDEDKDEGVPLPTLDAKVTPGKILNGSPLQKPLVDYGDDDEDEDWTPASRAVKKAVLKQHQEGNENRPPTPPTPAASPPSCKTEKREQEDVVVPPPKRRKAKDDDEEDELGKLSKNRRRSPTGGGNNAAAGGTAGMGRKRSFGLLGSNAAGQSPSKKIAISLAPKGSSGPNSPRSTSTSPTTATHLATTIAETKTEQVEDTEKKPAGVSL